jgi:carbohydrate-binding DOMON domain-containing protein
MTIRQTVVDAVDEDITIEEVIVMNIKKGSLVADVAKKYITQEQVNQIVYKCKGDFPNEFSKN